jgi:hypothetical protein
MPAIRASVAATAQVRLSSSCSPVTPAYPSSSLVFRSPLQQLVRLIFRPTSPRPGYDPTPPAFLPPNSAPTPMPRVVRFQLLIVLRPPGQAFWVHQHPIAVPWATQINLTPRSLFSNPTLLATPIILGLRILRPRALPPPLPMSTMMSGGIIANAPALSEGTPSHRRTLSLMVPLQP